MRPNLLILGGARGASALAARIADTGMDAVLSYAGRVASPRAQPIPTRSGGFGGAEGLAAYVLDNEITHIIDATHPFAARMSQNAIAASDRTGVPLIALTRPEWAATEGDKWFHVPDMATAADTLSGDASRIFLAIGRTEIAAFITQPQHHYLLRFVDAPNAEPPLANHTVVIDRGPFDLASDRALLEAHDIELIVSKNSGGEGARAKIDAARELGLPVLMVDRPKLPDRIETDSIEVIMTWIAVPHDGTDRGV